jgi:acyl carrier protein phosphodiesterase
VNFLAHIFLSGSEPDVMAGNFMGDSVRGSQADLLPADIRRGVQLHRAIDSYTDAHPVVALSKQRLRAKFGKYAPVVADVFYDHFLAAGWSAYSTEPLRRYVDRVYAELQNYYAQFPLRTQRFYDYMLRHDILYGYSAVEGIDRVMRGMARRARFESRMEKAAGELQDAYPLYQAEFSAFFPDLQQHIRTFSL